MQKNKDNIAKIDDDIQALQYKKTAATAATACPNAIMGGGNNTALNSVTKNTRGSTCRHPRARPSPRPCKFLQNPHRIPVEHILFEPHCPKTRSRPNDSAFATHTPMPGNTTNTTSHDEHTKHSILDVRSSFKPQRSHPAPGSSSYTNS